MLGLDRFTLGIRRDTDGKGDLGRSRTLMAKIFAREELVAARRFFSYLWGISSKEENRDVVCHDGLWVLMCFVTWRFQTPSNHDRWGRNHRPLLPTHFNAPSNCRDDVSTYRTFTCQQSLGTMMGGPYTLPSKYWISSESLSTWEAEAHYQLVVFNQSSFVPFITGKLILLVSTLSTSTELVHTMQAATCSLYNNSCKHCVLYIMA